MVFLSESGEEVAIFPCCPNKEQKLRLYCCVICHVIVHKSYWTRRKQMVHIGQHKIYCWNACVQQATENNTDACLQKLREENANLEKELDNRTKFYNDARKRSMAFEDDVFDMEDYYKKELEKHRIQIKQLEARVQVLTNSYNTSEITINTCGVSSIGTQTGNTFARSVDTQTQRDRQLVNGHALNETATKPAQAIGHFEEASTITAIDDDLIEEALLVPDLIRIQVPKSTQTDNSNGVVRTEDRHCVPTLTNNRYGLNNAAKDLNCSGSGTDLHRRLKKLRGKSAKDIDDRDIRVDNQKMLRLNHLNIDKDLSPRLSKQQFSKTNLHQVLILGDSTVTDIHKFLKIQKNENYNVVTFAKHNANLDNIVQDLNLLAKDFSQKDYVVISGGLQDARCGNQIKAQTLELLSTIGLRPNLIVLSVPLQTY